MAKTVTATTTKAATKAAVSKPTKSKTDADGVEKPKRPPTAYQSYCKEHMKKWNVENPGRAKEAMTHIAQMWKDAPENPNRGQEPKPRKPKAPKEPKRLKEDSPKAPKVPKRLKEDPPKVPKKAKPAPSPPHIAVVSAGSGDSEESYSSEEE